VGIHLHWRNAQVPIGSFVLKRGFIGFAMTLLAAGCAAPLVNTLPAAAPAAPSNPQSASNGAAVAPRPSEASVSIVSPTNGEVVKAGSVKVSISYSGQPLVPGAQATRLTDYHLHYLLDVDPKPYLGTGLPIPTGRPDIVHSAATEVTFENVAPGDHSVSIVMGGSNHVSVDPPLVDQVSFIAQ
jgi:hypothetical protein